MASPEPSEASPPSHAAPARPLRSPASVSHLRRYVSLRGPNTRMWMTAAYFSAVLTLGFFLVVGSMMWHVARQESTVSSVSLWALAGLFMFFLGPGSNAFLLRGLPQRITRQGISADSDGITVLQERKWWFPGEGTFIAWPQIRRIREVHIGERRIVYFIEFALDTHRTDAELPSWAESPQSLDLETDPGAATQFYVQVPKEHKEHILSMVERTAPLPAIVERSEPLR